MWSIIIDVILIELIVISVIVGITKGFLDSILSLVGTGLALLISVFLAKHVANFINRIFNFEDFVLKHLDGAEEGSMKIFGVIELHNVEVAKFAVWIATVIILFVLIKLAIYIVSKMFEAVVNSSPTVGGINRVLGMAFGLVKGGVMAIVSLALCTLLCQLPLIGNPVYSAIQDTKITRGVYNIVEDFVEKKLTKENIQEIIDKIVSDNEVPAEKPSGEGNSALTTNR